jgi:hypothetical protein
MITYIEEVISTTVVGTQSNPAAVAALIEAGEAITTTMRSTTLGMNLTTGIEARVVTITERVGLRPIEGHPAVGAHTTDANVTTSIMRDVTTEVGAEAVIVEIEADIIIVIIIGDLRAELGAILGILTTVAITPHLCIQEGNQSSHFIPSMFNTQEFPHSISLLNSKICLHL